MSLPKRVLIVGGTHGNEWTGIQIVKHYQQELTKKFPELSLEFIFANPEAHKINQRFKDEDLNRAFQFLHEKRENSYEHKRAKELKGQIDQSPCLVLDLHTTTANMGSTIILSNYHPVNLALCDQIKQKLPNCSIIGAPDPQTKYLASQSVHGLILEVGPVANGVVSAPILESSLQLIDFILECVRETTDSRSHHGQLEIFEEVRDVHYPKSENGEINSYIHSDFQGQDLKLVRGKFKAFKSYAGQEIELFADENLYPIFINEAAYYPQQLAFTLCRKNVYKF